MAIERKCDLCKADAKYDTPTVMGPWAYLCDDCMEQFGIKTSVTTTLKGK